MAEYSVKIKNLNEIKRAFNKSPKLTIKYLNTAIEGSVYLLERDVTQKGYSGQYYTNRTYSLTRNWVSMFQPLKGTLYSRMDYATYLHEGTGSIRPRPFLTDSVKDSERKIRQNFVDAVQHVFNDIGRSV
jgi:hypothetical protein